MYYVKTSVKINLPQSSILIKNNVIVYMSNQFMSKVWWSKKRHCVMASLDISNIIPRPASMRITITLTQSCLIQVHREWRQMGLSAVGPSGMLVVTREPPSWGYINTTHDCYSILVTTADRYRIYPQLWCALHQSPHWNQCSICISATHPRLSIASWDARKGTKMMRIPRPNTWRIHKWLGRVKDTDIHC